MLGGESVKAEVWGSSLGVGSVIQRGSLLIACSCLVCLLIPDQLVCAMFCYSRCGPGILLFAYVGCRRPMSTSVCW